MRSYMGDARGRWEETHSSSRPPTSATRSPIAAPTPATLKLIERFTPVAPDKINWAVTVDDPSTWTRPWTFAMPLTRDNSEPLFDYECHEGNYAMRNILSAARSEERAAAEDGRKASSGSPRAPAQPLKASRSGSAPTPPLFLWTVPSSKSSIFTTRMPRSRRLHYSRVLVHRPARPGP